jgi:hypothetical protein
MQKRAPPRCHGNVRPLMRGKTLVVTVIGWALAACSVSSFKAGIYRTDDLAFRVGALPPSYEALDAGNGRLAFRDESAKTTILVNARCRQDGDDVPLVALTNHLFMTFTNRETIEQKVEPMDGREALHTLMRAKLDGVAKSFDVYVLKKDGCVYDFINISSPETFDAARPVFERFVLGFRTLSKDE